MKNTFGFIFTSLSWWICVLSGKYLTHNLQLIILSIFVIASLITHSIYYIEDKKSFTLFYLLALSFGLFGDGLLFYFEKFSFSGNKIGPYPVWLLALWLVFPLNFLHALKKFLFKPIMAILFGVIGGPLAYRAGPAFGILELGENALYYVALFWALYMGGACLLRSLVATKRPSN
ncbi:MAG: DUF2878 domain-containing protein [Bacteriovoracaceae bacterium]|nr:DUF2878 domain-containing protein [Bacteriovoracaceae bacterium]